MTRVDTSELYREIRDLERHNKVLQKADRYREKIWKKRVADLEAERNDLAAEVIAYEARIKNALECPAHAHNAIQRMPDNPYGRFYRWSDIRLALRVGERLSDD